MKRVLSGVFALAVFSLLYSCNSVEPPPPPPPNGTTVLNTINLSVEWADLYRIKLKWNISTKDTINTFRYELNRKDELGGETTKNFFISGTDTSYIDGDIDSLASGKNFTYKVRAYDTSDKLIDTSKTLTAKTLAPTSHNIIWHIDTLGQPGDFLYDVWGLDENNVWAVGAININGIGTNIIKWNGEEWQAFPRASFPGWGNSIFGFNEADIWVVGGGTIATAARWTGSSWTEYSFYPPGQDTVWALRAVWGLSPDDVWAVGDKGTIIRWDGSEWKKVQSPINLILYDIWGTDRNDIYAIHISISQQSRLIKYDGIGWTDVTSQLPAGPRNFTSLWIDKSGSGYIVGNNVLYYNGGVFNRIEINQDKFLLKIRGRNLTDVFTVGLNGRVHHFNGIDWINYPELFDESFEMELRGVYVTETTVFAVGIINNGSIIYRGVRQ
jgi:hypothetical protein